MPDNRLTILVSGMVAATPYQGGATWAVLQYLLGFKRLGHDVVFVEPITSDALTPAKAPLVASANAAYFQDVMTEFDLEHCAAILLAGTRQTVGLTHGRLRQLARDADVLINIAGTLSDELPIDQIPVRVYLDLDPAYTQIWASTYGLDMGFAEHTHFVTIGQAIGRPECEAPDCGLPWIAARQPVVLEHWPVAEGITCKGLTTVANWRSYGSVEQSGEFYGQKAHSLRRFMDLPARTPETFALALSIHPGEVDDLVTLRDAGWRLLDPAAVAASPATYRAFIQGSKAEFGIAKDGYAKSRCGWFSDRSVCYLASGRPVIAQETGFRDFLPTGAGLFAFDTGDDVLRALESLNRDYAFHRRAARAIAADYFDSDKVLTELLQQIGVGS